MTVKTSARPSVPSGSRVQTQGSGQQDNRAEGAKNHWVRTGCHWNLKVCTYNVQSLSTDDRITDFEDELDNFNFDIIGLCEARRKGEGCLVLARSKHHLYFKGGDTHHRGVGFLVNKNIAGNVTAFKGISDRVAKLSIKINSRYSLDIIQAYLPTSNSTDEEVEAVYEDIDNLINNSRAHYKIIMGDFNAKVGMGDSSSSSTGPFGYGTRNSRGDTLVNFAERHKMRIMNTHFKKPPNRRWTWISPGGAYKNEIDYILTNKPQNFTDVSVINKFNTGSDHRMVRGSMTINTKLERAKLTKPRKPDEIKLKANTAQFQLQLSNRFEALTTSEDIDIECSNITSIIMETALKTGGQKKCNRPNKLSEETKQLREKRRQMKRDGTNAQNREYTEICKTIRKKMAEEITAYNEKEQQEALKASRGLKSVKRRQVLGRSKMTTLKEEDGTVIDDLDRMVKRCEEFYTNLYSTRQNTDRASTSTPRNNRTGEQNTERLPPILPSEVRAAIERLKLNKAPGDDNITAGILKCGGEPLVTKFTQIFNKCLSEGKVPSAWKNASIVLIHKKGDTNDIKNYHPHETPSSSPPPFCFAPAPFCFAPAKNLLRPRHDFRVDCELCRHWGLSRRTGAKQNCVGGVEERRGRSRFFAGAKQNGAGAKQNGGGEEEGVSWG
ncbi:hypothetical protein Bbelb_019560 [Branchiostoma belcheri]|nr:hypothetical protein Bbelb_019560 [Branchiostoma belcheri]